MKMFKHTIKNPKLQAMAMGFTCVMLFTAIFYTLFLTAVPETILEEEERMSERREKLFDEQEKRRRYEEMEAKKQAEQYQADMEKMQKLMNIKGESCQEVKHDFGVPINEESPDNYNAGEGCPE
ncbi:MAG TPA: hypothetical protein VNM45_14720 [Bacillus sp. (in: firmicutes)]|nr:hypothetical protein [Bacillus sp. (in: firmicutes)]